MTAGGPEAGPGGVRFPSRRPEPTGPGRGGRQGLTPTEIPAAGEGPKVTSLGPVALSSVVPGVFCPPSPSERTMNRKKGQGVKPLCDLCEKRNTRKRRVVAHEVRDARRGPNLPPLTDGSAAGMITVSRRSGAGPTRVDDRRDRAHRQWPGG